MERKSPARMIGVLIPASVSSGIIAFYVGGGIPILARDVGTDGAWIVALLFQSLYALFSLLGFLVYEAATRKFIFFAPSWRSVTVGAVVVAVTVNVYGLVRTGPEAGLAVIAGVVFGAATVIYALAALAFNGLTSH